MNRVGREAVRAVVRDEQERAARLDGHRSGTGIIGGIGAAFDRRERNARCINVRGGNHAGALSCEVRTGEVDEPAAWLNGNGGKGSVPFEWSARGGGKRPC